MKNIQYLKENGVDVDASVELFGDIELYDATMQDFLDGIDSKLLKLKTFKDLNEIENYAVFAHSVKSDARYLGFTTVAATALEHELAGKANNEKFIVDNYDFLIETVNQMIQIVKNYLTNEIEIPTSSNQKFSKTRKKIMVVDDAPLITNLITKTLGSDYEVLVFNSAKDASLHLINNHNEIDALLLDLNMPDMNGFDILELLKSNNLFEKIKVSIITGDESKDTISKAFRYPIVDMLNKPFSTQNLISTIEKAIA